MRSWRVLHVLCSNPPQAILRRTIARAVRTVDQHHRRRADLQHPTYSSSGQPRSLSAYWPDVEAPLTEFELTALRETSDHYLQHRFDLLGSGWVSVRHGMHCRGLSENRYEPATLADADPDGRWLHGRINTANLEHSRQAWSLVDRDYTPIDWHLDFKSGYRWSEATWYRDIRIGHAPGADVKVPWELARMQHLPRLAWAHALAAAEAEGFRPPTAYAREFRNQVLDFIATNPPRFGVNWYSSMDVGIRVANWLVAYDWLRGSGATWDSKFEETFIDSVEAHGQHIVRNLSWDPTWRGNHYLANIVGLLFVAAYLPRSATVDAWLAFATEQLIEEVRQQFSADGSNIESSTSYHRLSAEMVAFGTALVLALWSKRRDAFERYDHCLIGRRPRLSPAPLPRHSLPSGQGDSPFPPWYFERLQRMAEFTLHVTKPTGRIHQVGDNDSGRFLNLQPAYVRLTTVEAKARFANLAHYDELPADANYWVEDHLDHRPLAAAIAGLINRDDFLRFRGSRRVERPLVQDLIGRMEPTPRDCTGQQRQTVETHVGAEEQWRQLRQRLAANHRLRRYVHRIELSDAETVKDLERIAYSDFGLFIWRSPRFYLAVRCGPRKQTGPGAHAHNDQLAIELTVDQRDVLVDPGSCLYTPDPRQRNRYRSVTAHWAPRPIQAREPGRIDLGLFELDDRAHARCLYFGPRGFAGEHRGYDRPVYRVVELEPTAIVITDYADRAMGLRAEWPDRSGNQCIAHCPFSAGYGIVDAAHSSPGAPITVDARADLRPRTFMEDVHSA